MWGLEFGDLPCSVVARCEKLIAQILYWLKDPPCRIFYSTPAKTDNPYKEIE